MASRKALVAATPFNILFENLLIAVYSLVDLSKAFNKVNHNALFIKFMKRHIPVELIEILENLFHCCHSFVKWNKAWSSVIKISLGVRQ